MAKTCLIHQPRGIGDILFVQKIARHYADLGHPVVFPIEESLMPLARHLGDPRVRYAAVGAGDYPFKAEFLYLVEQSDSVFGNRFFDSPVENGDLIFLPLGPCYRRTLDRPAMTSKYDLAGLDYGDWADHVALTRNPDREAVLFRDVLGLTDDSVYALVNERASNAAVRFGIEGVPTVSLRPVEGYTLIDWCLVIERARAIATIDTSLVLLVEILGIRDRPLHLASRYRPATFQHIRDLLRLPWQFLGGS